MFNASQKKNKNYDEVLTFKVIKNQKLTFFKQKLTKKLIFSQNSSKNKQKCLKILKKIQILVVFNEFLTEFRHFVA